MKKTNADACSCKPVVANYCTTQMPWFRITVPIMRRFSLTGKRAVSMPCFMNSVPRIPWRPITAETCRANAVIAKSGAMIYLIGIYTEDSAENERSKFVKLIGHGQSANIQCLVWPSS